MSSGRRRGGTRMALARPKFNTPAGPVKGLLPEEIEAFYAGVNAHREQRYADVAEQVNQMRRAIGR